MLGIEYVKRLIWGKMDDLVLNRMGGSRNSYQNEAEICFNLSLQAKCPEIKPNQRPKGQGISLIYPLLSLPKNSSI